MKILIQGGATMDRQQKELLLEIMNVSFALLETALYLNTHPNDAMALSLHNDYSKKYSQLVSLYENRYGPLTNTGYSGDYWSYIDEPWPWDIDFRNY